MITQFDYKVFLANLALNFHWGISINTTSYF